jgi:hypothetical protein
MNAIRLHTRVDSDLFHLPELKAMLGKTVEIIILEEMATPGRSPQAPGCFTTLLPKGAFDPKALEAMRVHLTKEQYEALSAIASQDLLDVDAIAELRAASMI